MKTHRTRHGHRKSGGFLLLVVMGLLSLLLVLCVGFIVMVRAQTQTVMHQRERTDLLNVAYSGLDWGCAQIAGRIFTSDKVDASQYVDSAYANSEHTTFSSNPAKNLSWYKDLSFSATTATNWNGSSGYPAMAAKRQTKWVYLPADYFLEGGLRARIAVQILDNNAFISGNDWLQDASPSQAQQTHMLQAALGNSGGESYRAKVMHSVFSQSSILPSPSLLNQGSKYLMSNKKRSSVTYPGGNTLFRYSDVWGLTSHAASGSATSTTTWDAPTLHDILETWVYEGYKRKFKKMSPHSVANNMAYFNWGEMSATFSQSLKLNMGSVVPQLSCHPYTDPDTGHSPLNVNTCFNSGEAAVGPNANSNFTTQKDIEGVFNVGALRRIIKVGSFYASNTYNSGVVPGMRYLDPKLYPGNKDHFDFTVLDAKGRPTLKIDPATIGKPDPATIGTLDPATGLLTPNTAPRISATGWGYRDPDTAGTIDPATVTIDPNNPPFTMSYAKTYNPRLLVDLKTALDNATAALTAAQTAKTNAINNKSADLATLAADIVKQTAAHTLAISSPTPANIAAAAAADVLVAYDTKLVAIDTAEVIRTTAAKDKAQAVYDTALAAYNAFDGPTWDAYNNVPGSIGRPYVYKSYDDLYVALDTEEKVQLEELKTQLAVYYQEALCRYFVASYSSNGGRYPPYDATISSSGANYKYCCKNYKNTYAPLLGATGDDVGYAAATFDYSLPRFPYSTSDFRDHVKADLIAMATNNNNKAAWGYNAGANKDGGEYVHFDITGKPEICPGKLDKRTASAIFDNICPGKRFLFPTEANLEIKDPIGQLYKRRIGIDEEAINWIHQTPMPLAPSEQLWKPKPTGTFTEVATVTPPPKAGDLPSMVRQGGVNPPRMNDPYHLFLYKEDWNENGVLDIGEDLVKNQLTWGTNGDTYSGAYGTDPDTGGLNANGVLDYFLYDEDIALMLDNGKTAEANIAMESSGNTFRERGQEVWTADPSNPVKGHDYLSSSGYNRFLDENVYFNTSENPINPANFDPTKPNCLIHPLPADGTFVKDSNGYMVATVQSALLSDFNGNGKFDTIEYIPGHATLDNGGAGVDLNGDGVINTYYRTPDRQLVFGADSFSTELTTTSVSYRMVVTVELCDAASVTRNPAAPITVGHTEFNAAIQLAPDVETSSNKSPDDPNIGMHYYRNNQPTIRKTRTYEADGSITTYDATTSAKVTYDPRKEEKGLQIRGGIVDDNSSNTVTDYNTDHSSAAREWIDPLGVPSRDSLGNLTAVNYGNYYTDAFQNKRRFVIRDIITFGVGY